MILISRRRLFQTLGVASGVVAGIAALPDKWTKPIIESVYLPVHAQTTLRALRLGGPVGGLVNNSSNSNNSSSIENIVDSIVSTAHAETILTGSCLTVFIASDGVGSFQLLLPNNAALVGEVKSNGVKFIGSGDGLNIRGAYTSPTSISGTINDGGPNYGFTIDEAGADGCNAGPVPTPTGPVPTSGPTNPPGPTSTPTSTSIPPPPGPTSTPTSTSIPPPPGPTNTPTPTSIPTPPTPTITPTPTSIPTPPTPTITPTPTSIPN